MKKIYNFFLFTCLSSLGFAQANFTVTAPDIANTTTLRAPNGTSAHTTIRAHVLVLASELTSIPSGTNLTQLGFSLAAGIPSGSANGTLKFYLENTTDVTNVKNANWVTGISTMTNVYNGTYTVPVSAGPVNVDFTLTSPFNYTGGGIYVSYEYIASAVQATAASYNANNVLANGIKMIATTTTTPGPDLTATSAFRPSFRFIFPNPYTNEMQVLSMNTPYGVTNNLIQTTQSITANVKNASSVDLSNVSVTLNTTGATTYSDVQVIPSIVAGNTVLVTFNNVPTSSLGAQTVSVSVPADDNNTNNQLTYNQSISCDTLSRANSGIAVGSIGFNTGAGILATRYNVATGVPVMIKKVGIGFSTNAASVGNTVKGVLCNSAGAIIDSTQNFTITNANLGAKVYLPFINGNVNYAGQEVYIGFRQTANVTGYFPLGTQTNDMITPNLYYSLGINGADTASYTTLGVFMLDAVLKAQANFTSTAANNSVCPNTPVTFSGTPGYANYAFTLNSNSAQNGPNSSYTTTPTGTQTYGLTMTRNACSFTPSALTITSAAVTNTINASICNGASYTFGSNTYNTTGQYFDTLPAQGGCDSIITLNLTVLAPTQAGTVTATICNGDVYNFNGQQLTSAGSYSAVVQNGAGCDSTVNLTLAVTTIGIGVTQTGATLQATQTGATYQWLNCSNNSPVAGATSATFVPANSGQYKVKVTIGACSDTSACYTVDYTGLEENEQLNTVVVYPNPTAGNVNVQLNAAQVSAIRLLDLNGRVLKTIPVQPNTANVTLDLSTLANGTYMVQISSENNAQTRLINKK